VFVADISMHSLFNKLLITRFDAFVVDGVKQISRTALAFSSNAIYALHSP